MMCCTKKPQVVIAYDAEHTKHKGPLSSPENPDRVDAIVNYLWEKSYIDWDIMEEPLPTISHSRATQRNCSACTSPLRSNLCDICGSMTKDIWSYVQDKDGDTTYQTPYTDLIVERARCLVTRHMAQLCHGPGSREFRFILTRPPGHHACRDYRIGFCHHNFAIDALDIAFAAGKKAIILDIDAHHGDGTEAEIRLRNYGYYCSIHAFGPNIYPGTGMVSDDAALNLHLPSSSGDAEWCAMMSLATSWIKDKAADIVILSCGFDGHAADTIVPLHLTLQAYRSCSMALYSLGLPVLAILEGGYHIPVLGECVEAILSRFILKP
jgi:acetoin utilization deacetylase AcuC-like enzyme